MKHFRSLGKGARFNRSNESVEISGFHIKFSYPLLKQLMAAIRIIRRDFTIFSIFDSICYLKPYRFR
jgi:hypothetical protein